MFTWNFQYVSKARLAEAFSQLMLDSKKGDILVRIHTAIHMEEEAVDLARFIKKLAPEAHIFGTSTSAIISWGKLIQNQCVVSVTQMSRGTVRTALLPTFTEDGLPVPEEELARRVRDAVVEKDTRLMLTFLTGKYLGVYNFVEKCNDVFPGVQMIGGLANTSEINLRRFLDSGFVFNETGYSDKGIILASISGDEVESFSSYATGVQAIGEESEITDTFGTCVLSVNGRDAAREYRIGVGNELKDRPELTNLFPYVYSDASDIPIFVRFSDDRSLSEIFDRDEPMNRVWYQSHQGLDVESKRELICANHNVRAGKKLKRAFIYDRKVITDNRSLFRRVENFEKAETIFGYSCIARSMIYSNCVKWELSAYENSNMCGCITEGEIAHVDGRNTFANCSFVVAVIGEEPATQKYNPYAFSHTDSLVADNRELLNYLYNIEHELSVKEDPAADSLKAFVRDCELKLLYSDKDEIPNAAAMNMDIKLKGYDRICMINVIDTEAMKMVFPEQLIDLTYKSFTSKCVSFAKQKGYSVYVISDWHLAVGAPSYMFALSEFVADMEQLQKELFETAEDYIAIVPIFCVLDDCTVEDLNPAYNSARLEMANKNIQFSVRDAKQGQLDEESIRERYRMVNVINYAISHDKVIPYFQGIYDNNTGSIHHYEALMRLQDENGKIYYPGSFLDVARSYGLLYDSLSKMMISKVFEKFRNISGRSVSMNIGMRDIKNRDMVEFIYEFLSTVEHPENFVFEILENEDIDDYDMMMAFVDKVHELGGQISIDDFGSGFSNLQHIANIHSDFLKIDGSIVKNCVDDEQSANLIKLISGWKTLSSQKFMIIAEYVENQEIQDLLLNFGIDYSQGYLFSRPGPELEQV
ncbi:MAG: EAL domain-containing protein [Ruminococcus sp.]|nr:EAL domain-containing protein [Ruminococcus sp.]